jgi:hypothetical protein
MQRAASSIALRRSEISRARLFSSTITPGQSRAINSSFVTTSPRRSTRKTSASNARG